MMLMDTVSIQLIVTMVTKEEENSLPVKLRKSSVSSLARDLLEGSVLTTFNNLHLVQ